MLGDERKTGPSRVAEELLPCDPVLDRRPHGRLTLLKVDADQAPARLQGTSGAAQERCAIGKVVVGVDDQHEVAGAGGQVRVVATAQHGRHVADAKPLEPLTQSLEAPWLRVDRVHVAARANGPRQSEREVARACADVGHDCVRPRAQRAEHARRPLPAVATGIEHSADERLEVLRPEAVVAAAATHAAVTTAVRMPCHGGESDIAVVTGPRPVASLRASRRDRRAAPLCVTDRWIAEARSALASGDGAGLALALSPGPRRPWVRHVRHGISRRFGQHRDPGRGGGAGVATRGRSMAVLVRASPTTKSPGQYVDRREWSREPLQDDSPTPATTSRRRSNSASVRLTNRKTYVSGSSLRTRIARR